MIFKKIANIILTILVFIYIIFEEVIWEKFAKPIKNFISNLELFTNLEPKIEALNTYFVLFIFILMFVFVELLGVYAGIIFLLGHIYLGIFIYLLKIPMAAFIFWFFGITKDKLLQFKWFFYIYKFLLWSIRKIKNSYIYRKIEEKIDTISDVISSENSLKNKIIEIYHKIKDIK